ncbi:hypothetical protein DFO67_102105 [Modicisalibacter xianhensis]|uniref:Uncharacterized protein n=1 Tax=Modicisalibacter xianhensis TaxID=442341 RepID=A0A4R8G6B9_9GAMM|nr:hypothetical protein [Halomonas xianhensis]TDX32156.1 hypothetical protein DFO67_102105 [Halomonas xianhensis]
MSSIIIHPLPGHPFLIEALEAARSPHELLGGSLKTPTTGAADVLLTHPPVLLIHEGGGEQLLNRDAVTAQLNYRKRGQKGPGTAVPASLRVWIIDPKMQTGAFALICTFIFGPIQRMYYQKKDLSGEACWKTVMRNVEKTPDLKSALENTLFAGEALAPRHYLTLLNAAQVGESSVNHELGRIRDKPKKNRASPSVPPSIVANTEPENRQTRVDAGLSSEPLAEALRNPFETGFDMANALIKISQAAERGTEQFALGIEMEGC